MAGAGENWEFGIREGAPQHDAVVTVASDDECWHLERRQLGTEVVERWPRCLYPSHRQRGADRVVLGEDLQVPRISTRVLITQEEAG